MSSYGNNKTKKKLSNSEVVQRRDIISEMKILSSLEIKKLRHHLEKNGPLRKEDTTGESK